MQHGAWNAWSMCLQLSPTTQVHQLNDHHTLSCTTSYFFFTDAIRDKIIEWTDKNSYDLILTSGGTGFGPRDITPEVIRPLLHREAPGVAQALLSEGLKHTALAVLSRPVAGTRFGTFICCLPGR